MIVKKLHSRPILVLKYKELAVSLDVLSKQLFSLAKRGFTPITFEEYFAYQTGETPFQKFPRKPIIITFDGSYDYYESLLPILREFNFKAVMLILGVLINDRVLKLLKNAGMEAACLGLTRTSLTSLEIEYAYHEINGGKENLNLLLQKNPATFVYPYGDYNAEIETLLKEAGFKCAITKHQGMWKIQDNVFEIPNVEILPSETRFSFWRRTSRWYWKFFGTHKG
jgi:peptidoglycan/xylan/chitin deacetylase (PgdA/CDA1 family)